MKLQTIEGAIRQDTWLEDVKTLAVKVKSSWNASDLKVSVLSGGCINGIYRCQNLASEETSILFRVFNVKLNFNELRKDWDDSKFSEEERKAFEERTKQAMTHDYEITVMRDMGELGLAAKLHARFENGICYDYLEGTILTPKLIQENPFIVDKLAKMLAALHSYQPPQYIAEKKGEGKNPLGNPEMLKAWCSQVISQVKPVSETSEESRYKEFFKLTEGFEKEITDTWIDSDSELVWCHGDLNLSNIIYNAKTGDLNFIDWEMTNYNQAERDIGALFSQFCGHLNDGYDLAFYPTEETQKRFLRLYLDTYYKKLGKEPETDIEEEVVRLRKLANRAALHTHLGFGMIFVSLAARELKSGVESDDDKLGYGLARIQAFKAQKDAIMAI